MPKFLSEPINLGEPIKNIFFKIKRIKKIISFRIMKQKQDYYQNVSCQIRQFPYCAPFEKCDSPKWSQRRMDSLLNHYKEFAGLGIGIHLVLEFLLMKSQSAHRLNNSDLIDLYINQESTKDQIELVIPDSGISQPHYSGKSTKTTVVGISGGEEVAQNRLRRAEQEIERALLELNPSLIGRVKKNLKTLDFVSLQKLKAVLDLYNSSIPTVITNSNIPSPINHKIGDKRLARPLTSNEIVKYSNKNDFAERLKREENKLLTKENAFNLSQENNKRQNVQERKEILPVPTQEIYKPVYKPTCESKTQSSKKLKGSRSTQPILQGVDGFTINRIPSKANPLLTKAKYGQFSAPGLSKLEAQSHPTSQSSEANSNIPTFQSYTANPTTGDIQDINVAFDQFRNRMTEIGNQYTGSKKDEFFKRLNKCSINRFKTLSTENGRVVFNTVREAEFMLQYEFEGHCEENSVRRTTDIERATGNVLDGRFNKIKDNYTDFDVKGPVSQETSDYQAKTSLKPKRAKTMYEQGYKMGESITAQKRKHCNPNISERPSSHKNVKHIVSLIEMSVDEKGEFIAGLTNGLKDSLAEKNQVSKELLSDKVAFDGVFFLNTEFTIKRVN